MYPNIKIIGMNMNSWLFFTILGYAAAIIGIFKTRPNNFSVEKEKMGWAIFGYAVAAVCGVMLLNMIIHPEAYIGLPTNIALKRIGGAYLGELIFGILVVWILSRTIKFSFLDFADLGLPFIMLARAISRIGCFLTGCCYGIPTALPWGVKFLRDGVPRHPTQIYEVAYTIATFITGRFIYRKLRAYKGLCFFYCLFVYFSFRFFNEFLRQEGPYLFGRIKLSHPSFLLIIIVAYFGMISSIKWARQKGLKDDTVLIMSKALLFLLVYMVVVLIVQILLILLIKRIWF